MKSALFRSSNQILLKAKMFVQINNPKCKIRRLVNKNVFFFHCVASLSDFGFRNSDLNIIYR